MSVPSTKHFGEVVFYWRIGRAKYPQILDFICIVVAVNF